jgi:hypothetical protein
MSRATRTLGSNVVAMTEAGTIPTPFPSRTMAANSEDSPVTPLQQRGFNGCFQSPNRPRQRRLRDRQPLRGTREASLLGHCHEIPKQPQIDLSHRQASEHRFNVDATRAH